METELLSFRKLLFEQNYCKKRNKSRGCENSQKIISMLILLLFLSWGKCKEYIIFKLFEFTCNNQVCLKAIICRNIFNSISCPNMRMENLIV